MEEEKRGKGVPRPHTGRRLTGARQSLHVLVVSVLINAHDTELMRASHTGNATN